MVFFPYTTGHCCWRCLFVQWIITVTIMTIVVSVMMSHDLGIGQKYPVWLLIRPQDEEAGTERERWRRREKDDQQESRGESGCSAGRMKKGERGFSCSAAASTVFTLLRRESIPCRFQAMMMRLMMIKSMQWMLFCKDNDDVENILLNVCTWRRTLLASTKTGWRRRRRCPTDTFSLLDFGHRS